MNKVSSLKTIPPIHNVVPIFFIVIAVDFFHPNSDTRVNTDKAWGTQILLTNSNTINCTWVIIELKFFVWKKWLQVLIWSFLFLQYRILTVYLPSFVTAYALASFATAAQEDFYDLIDKQQGNSNCEADQPLFTAQRG